MHAPRTILIVDDEPSVLAIVEIVLNRAGYQVLTSLNPRAALAHSGNAEHPIDLLLTDVVMPDLDGPQLAALFRRNSPRTKVLFMTGHVARMGTLQSDPVLRKPFRPNELVEAVERTLVRAATAAAS